MSLYLAKLCLLLYSLFHLRVPGRHGKMGGSNQVRVKLIGLQVKRVILSGLKQVRVNRDRLGQVDPYFSQDFFFFKENDMYLPFGKLSNKLLDVK